MAFVTPPWLSTISDWSGQGILSILGPTGSGKTRLALNWVQENFPQDKKRVLLVSVDSVAMYQQLDIGSAKPLGPDRSDFDWVGLDLFPPSQSINVQEFLSQVRPSIVKALAAGRPVICVGGSHFYERALIDGQAPGVASNSDFQKTLQEISTPELAQRLFTADARFAEKIHANDRYRLSRFLDLVLHQKISFDELYRRDAHAWEQPLHRIACGMETSKEEHSEQLRRRISQMLEMGWVAEVQTILAMASPQYPALGSVGYQEVWDYFSGKIKDLVELKNLILTRHLQLAKKQRTWIRGLKNKQPF